MKVQELYQCVAQFMNIIQLRQVSHKPSKLYYHAELVITHFLESRHLFNQQPSFFRACLKYYEQRWLLQDSSQQSDVSSNTILRELDKQNEVWIYYKAKINKKTCQIVVYLLINAIESILNLNVETRRIAQAIELCNELKYLIGIQGLNFVQILKSLIEKIVNEVQNLSFYQTCLKIFRKVNCGGLVALFENKIDHLKEEWKKKQQSIAQNILNQKKRETVFLSSTHRKFKSIRKDPSKNSNHDKQNPAQLQKSKQRKSSGQKTTTFKPLKTKSKFPVSSHRKSIYQGNKYQFSRKSSKSQLLNESQNLPLHHVFFQSQKSFIMSPNSSLAIGKFSQKPSINIDKTEENILVNQTPERKKKKQKESRTENV